MQMEAVHVFSMFRTKSWDLWRSYVIFFMQGQLQLIRITHELSS